MSLLLNTLKAQRIISRTFCARRLFPSHRITARSICGGRATVQPSALDKQVSTSCTRSLSTYGGSNYNNNIRAYPKYSVFGENFLGMKIMPPGFRLIKNEILALDNTRKGRILLEFSPRGPDGKYVWTEVIRFGLGAEEVGLLVNQLPHYKVEFSRVAQGTRNDSGEQSYGGAVVSDMPEKVLTVEPGEHGAVNFTIDFVRDGVGGQSTGDGTVRRAAACVGAIIL